MRSLTRPRPAPAPAPDHGQANAKMTGCCSNCASWGGWVFVWEVGVWMRLASRRQLKSNERAASLGRLIAGRCSASMAKNVHTPPLSLSHSRSSACGHLGITGIRISKKAPSPRVASLPVTAPVNWIRWTIRTFCLLSLRFLMPAIHGIWHRNWHFEASQSEYMRLCVCMNAYNSETI